MRVDHEAFGGLLSEGMLGAARKVLYSCLTPITPGAIAQIFCTRNISNRVYSPAAPRSVQSDESPGVENSAKTGAHAGQAPYFGFLHPYVFHRGLAAIIILRRTDYHPWLQGTPERNASPWASRAGGCHAG